MSQPIWTIEPAGKQAFDLAQAMGLPLPIARILINRGVVESAEAAEFLYGTLENLHNPFLMRDMAKAVERIRNAISNKEKILIFGDYDADGILSVVMLYKAIASLGGNVSYFIPERFSEGYGVKEHHVNVAASRNCSLVISVDCGIKAVDFTAKAGKLGIDVIITDHHLPGEKLPGAAAILNPVLPDSGYPDKGLAGVGVVFKLIQALFEREEKQKVIPHYMKLVCIGTVADVVELKGENRLFVKYGLEGLENVHNPGLRQLIVSSGLGKRKISENDLGFRIGPRINAAGRMGQTELALQLFFSESDQECEALARQLEELNARRQRTEEKIFVEAREKIVNLALAEKYNCLILGSENWHRGVIGIVASKLKDYFNRPVILFAYENGKAHGSGRSISDVSLIDFLTDCRDILHDYGGHKHAIGCTLDFDLMHQFKKAINEIASAKISPELLQKRIRIDTPLSFAEIDANFLQFYSRLGPFGAGNPRPYFLGEKVLVVSEPVLLNDRHIKFLASQNRRVFEVIGWEKAYLKEKLSKNTFVDIVFSISMTEYRGESFISLIIEDLKW